MMTTLYDEGHAAPKNRRYNLETAPLGALCRALAIKTPITLARAIHGSGTKLPHRSSGVPIDLATLAFAWQSTVRFLSAIVEGRDEALDEEQACRILNTNPATFRTWRKTRFAVQLRPALTSRPCAMNPGSGRGTVRWSKRAILRFKEWRDVYEKPPLPLKAMANASQASGVRK